MICLHLPPEKKVTVMWTRHIHRALLVATM
jgi:hypothetical protein